MSISTEWLDNHCFEHDDKNDEYYRIKEWSSIELFAKYLIEINKWIVTAKVNVDGKRYRYSMMMQDITDDNFRMFVWSYNKEVRKQPFGFISNYHLDFTNNVIS